MTTTETKLRMAAIVIEGTLSVLGDDGQEHRELQVMGRLLRGLPIEGSEARNIHERLMQYAAAELDAES